MQAPTPARSGTGSRVKPTSLPCWLQTLFLRAKNALSRAALTHSLADNPTVLAITEPQSYGRIPQNLILKKTNKVLLIYHLPFETFQELVTVLFGCETHT